MYRYRLTNGQFVYSREILSQNLPGIEWAPSERNPEMERFVRNILAILTILFVLGNYLHATNFRSLRPFRRWLFAKLARLMSGNGVFQRRPRAPNRRRDPPIIPEHQIYADQGVQAGNPHLPVPEANRPQHQQDENRPLVQLADGTPEFFRWLRGVQRRRRQQDI